MKFGTACAVALAVVASLGLAQDMLPPHVLLQLSNEAAAAARATGALPRALTSLDMSEARLTPVFAHEPRDAERRERWHAHGLHRWFRLEGTARPAEEAAAALRRDGDITDVALSHPHHALIQPNDFTLRNMWGLTRMSCPAAWDIHRGTSPVIVTTIDTGCRIDHPDLAANMYVNPGEDLNGNGVWDASDNNGVDDDLNGYVDDLTGWDFVSVTDVGPSEQAVGEEYGPGDNQVYPDVHGHGTHVMGTAAGVTDNGTGVASASWNVRALPLRAGFAWIGSNGQLYGSGYEGDFAPAIAYAADMGAKVISISFGGGQSAPFYQAAINYARDLGTLVFAAAGNGNSSSRVYPAALDSVMAVVATDQNDFKASFSSYGTWTDISAPGVAIWSTMSNNIYHAVDYASWNGTSMACPNAAAVAGLLWSYMPALTVPQVEILLRDGCDNIYALNPGYAGMLGAGRINAYNSLNAACGIPAAPEVTILPQGSGVRLSWPAVPCATSYIVRSAATAGGNFTTLTTTAETTVVDPVGGGQQRFYHVIAVQ